MNILSVHVMFIFLDTEMMALDKSEPVPGILTRGNTADVPGIENCIADFGDKLGNLLIGLNIEADEYNVILGLELDRGVDIKGKFLGIHLTQAKTLCRESVSEVFMRTLDRK